MQSDIRVTKIGEIRLDERCNSLFISKSNHIFGSTNTGRLLKYSLKKPFDLVKQQSTSSSSIWCLRPCDNFFCVGRDTNIEIWSYDLSLLRTLSGHSDTVVGIFKIDSHLITASQDSWVFGWNLTEDIRDAPVPHFELYKHNGSIISCDLGVYSKLLVSTCTENSFECYSIKEKRKISSFITNEKIWSVKFVNNDSHIVTGNHEGVVCIRKVSDLNTERQIFTHDSRVVFLTLSADNLLLSCSFDQTAVFYDMEKDIMMYRVSDHKDWVRCAGFNNINSFVTTGDDKVLFIYDYQGIVRDKKRLRENQEESGSSCLHRLCPCFSVRAKDNNSNRE